MASPKSAWRYEINLTREAIQRAIGELMTAEKRLIEAEATGQRETQALRDDVAKTIKMLERLNRSLTFHQATA